MFVRSVVKGEGHRVKYVGKIRSVSSFKVLITEISNFIELFVKLITGVIHMVFVSA